MVYTLLTTLERVKRRGSIRSDNDDQLIEDVIAEVSADAEDHIGRYVISTARTESFRIRAHEHNVSLLGYPVATLTSVKVHSRDDDWANVTALDASLYVLDADAGTVFLRGSVTHNPTWVQVVYTGGLVSASGDDPVGLTKNFIASYPQIAGAIDQEVVMRLQRRKMAGAGQIVHKGAMKQMPKDVGLLADTRRRLGKLKPVRVS